MVSVLLSIGGDHNSPISPSPSYQPPLFVRGAHESPAYDLQGENEVGGGSAGDGNAGGDDVKSGVFVVVVASFAFPLSVVTGEPIADVNWGLASSVRVYLVDRKGGIW